MTDEEKIRQLIARFAQHLDVGTPEHFAAASAAAGMIVVAGSTAVEAFR